MYVVVQFYFLLFWGMIMYMYDNEFETKKKTKFKPRIKLNYMYHSNYIQVNQLPRLSGRWVPGIPRGFHCGQPAPR